MEWSACVQQGCKLKLKTNCYYDISILLIVQGAWHSTSIPFCPYNNPVIHWTEWEWLTRCYPVCFIAVRGIWTWVSLFLVQHSKHYTTVPLGVTCPSWASSNLGAEVQISAPSIIAPHQECFLTDFGFIRANPHTINSTTTTLSLPSHLPFMGCPS